MFHVDRLQPYYESDSNAFPNRIQVDRPTPPIEAPDAEWVVETILDRCWRETRILRDRDVGVSGW